LWFDSILLILCLALQTLIDARDSPDSEQEAENSRKSQIQENNSTNSMNQSLLNVYKKHQVVIPEVEEVDTSEKKRKSKESSGSSTKKQRLAVPSPSDFSSTPTPGAKLSDMGGIDECIEQIMELIGMPLKHPEIYLHLGIAPPRGILLHGPAGCGKTMLANAIAAQVGVPFFSISAPSIVSGMSGESEKKIRQVFEQARDFAPCLLFIDEIDAITPKRETAQREMVWFTV
jgi:ribosome biogenesis ATPase